MGALSPDTANATTLRYRSAMEARDVDGVLATFAPNAVVHPAITSASNECARPAA